MPLQKQRQRKLLEGTMKKQLEAAECSVAFDETYQLVVPERPGYTFSGWYCGEEKLTDGDGKSILAWTFAEDRQLTAGWTINSYELTVTNDSAFGEIVDISGRKEYNAEITVTVEATHLGYTFLGWYEGEKLLGTELSYTFSMLAKDVTYTAKWVENEEMAPFDFTSTPTTCVVTGVKDKTARSFVVPVYVTEIGEGAFSACTRLTTINIPERVTSIGDYAFYVCDKLTSVYYESTEESWNTIEKGHSIFDSAAMVYYYSESEPARNEEGTAYEGNYWRYDTDGVTPVIWKKEN